MQKFPFSPSGLQELLDQLYQLPDNELTLEATSAATDFKRWLTAKFEFEQSQLDYLDMVSTQFIVNVAQQVQYFLLARKPIRLTKQEQSERNSTADKIVVVNGDKKSSYSPDEGYAEEEVLNFRIVYQEKG